MEKKYFALFIFLICKFTFADINPEINMPADFNDDNFIAREINDNSSVSYNTAESGGCSIIKFKEYRSSPKNTVSTEGKNPANTFPVNTWVCLSSDTVYNNGYDRSMNEKIIYSKSKYSWVKVNNKKSDIILSDQDGPYKPLKLYNIKAKNAKGYVVFDENITKDNKGTYKNAKELVSFCLVQDSTYNALCGLGSLASDSNQIPYVLKTLESMEIGLDNKVNEKILNGRNKQKVN
ncbi:hypothetical protein [uncultured Cedecea sp.]|uniref:hypothetical protein n=1 Tax=uncultured Cedecea sp. TaxID=988762 RepID=UPI0026190E68|nr:hypothetical protein [uncultured Cedecea sp.]